MLYIKYLTVTPVTAFGGELDGSRGSLSNRSTSDCDILSCESNIIVSSSDFTLVSEIWMHKANQLIRVPFMP